MPVIKHGSGATSAFKTVKVSGQSDVVADAGSDDLTLAAGSNVTITTNAGTDTVTIASTGGAALDGIDDQSSSLDDCITILDAEVVINEDGDDQNFRVESDTKTHMLFVDAGTNQVGINTSASVNKSLSVVDSAIIKGKALFTLTGTIDPAASTTVTGSGTAFLTEVSPGDQLVVSGETRTVRSVTNDTTLVLDVPFTNGSNDTSPDCNPAAFTVLKDGGTVAFSVDGDETVQVGTCFKIQTEDDATVNQSARLFFKESITDNLYGFSQFYTGDANPVFAGTTFTAPANSFNIFRHQNSEAGVPVMTMERGTGNIGVGDDGSGGITVPNEKISVDGAVSLKEQASVPSGTADYAKIVAMEDGVDSNTKVLLHGDGTAGASTFTNTGSGSTWTGASGDPTTETAQKKFGTAAMYFDGNDSIEMPGGDLGDVAMGTGDFTIEFWMRLDAEPSGAIGIMSGLGTAAGGRSAIENGMYLQYYHASDERCAFRWRSKTNPSMRIDVSWNPHWRALTWYHIAVVRDGNEFIIYQNGRPQVTRDYGTDTQPGADELEEIDSQFRLGEGQNSDWFTGYIDQFRISKGVARYKKAFTPPGAAFPITRLYAVNSAGDKTLIG